ncbi:MAG: four helix bundle protein [Prevotella sp.]|nr:four helix bundle protein [Prevotella sp.]
MNESSPILRKSLAFAVRIVKLSVYLQEKLGYTFTPVIQQILKSGTSIGANVREAEYAESKDDFVHKLKISLKEANETEYWLNVLLQCGYLEQEGFDSLLVDCKELLKLLISIINSSKK